MKSLFENYKKKQRLIVKLTIQLKQLKLQKKTIMYVKFKHHHRRYFFNFNVNMFNVFRNKNE